MIFIIIICVIALFIAIEDGDASIFFAGSIGGSLIAICILLIASLVFHDYKGTFVYKEVKREILSLDDGENISGSFFLGSGRIGSSQIFSYYYKTDDGGYKRGNEYASRVTIYEDEDNNPYIQYNKSGRKHYKSKWVFWVLLFNRANSEVKYSNTKSIEFHVPQNTIIREINLDNK